MSQEEIREDTTVEVASAQNHQGLNGTPSLVVLSSFPCFAYEATIFCPGRSGSRGNMCVFQKKSISTPPNLEVQQEVDSFCRSIHPQDLLTRASASQQASRLSVKHSLTHSLIATLLQIDSSSGLTYQLALAYSHREPHNQESFQCE